MYEIAINFVSCFIVWLVWFLIAKSKNNHKQMLISTESCFACFIVLVWGALCGVACLGAYALINHLKKSFPEIPKEERENEHNHQKLETYSAWKNPVTVEKEDTQETSKTVTPVPYTKPEDIAQIEDTDEIDKATNWGAFIIAIMLILVLVAIIFSLE